MSVSYMLTSIADSKPTFQITESHFLSQWMIWFWKRKISCFLIQPWYSWVFALKWYFCQKCRWKRFYRDVVPHVLTGSLRNVFFFGGGGEGGGGGGKVNRVFNSVWKASLRYLHEFMLIFRYFTWYISHLFFIIILNKLAVLNQC